LVTFLDLGGQFSADIASIDDSIRFEREYYSLDVSAPVVLDAARHDEKAGRSEHDIMISHPDGDDESSVETKKSSSVSAYRCQVTRPGPSRSVCPNR
jgi:hypothetical protein